MISFSKFTLGCVTAAIMFAGAQRATAETLTVTNSGQVIVAGLSDPGVINGSYYAGMYTGTLSGGQQFDIYCVDISHDISWNAVYGVTTGFLTPSSALYGPILPAPTAQNNIAAVMEVVNLNPNNFNLTFSLPSNIPGSPTNNPDIYGAIQIALWNAEYNGFTHIPTTPLSITVDATAQAYANKILDAAKALTSNQVADGMNHTELFSAVPGQYQPGNLTGQSMVTWINQGGGHQSVPEPSSFALLGLGGLGLALNAIRRRRNASAA